MTVLVKNFDNKNSNNDVNLDTQSTAEMIISENGSFKHLNNAKIISGTIIIITILMGFFLLSAVYIQTASKCVCNYGSVPNSYQESRNSPYFEPLKSLSSDTSSKEMRNFPLKIHMNDPKNFLNGDSNSGRVSCEVTRKTASQVIASEPKELQTAYGNLTTDPKLLHLTSEKLFFSCYNGEKPKPILLIARPRIFAIFHRKTSENDSNSTESDESSSSSSSESNSNESDEKPVTLTNVNKDDSTTSSNVNKDDKNERLIRNRREASKETMDCTCSCPKN